MKIRKIFVFLLASVLLLALSACSEKEASDPNCFDLGKYEIYYKGSCIMYSETGKDALVMTFDFTNNSKGTASYGLNVCEKLMQNGEEMESAYVITDMETYAGVSGDYFTTVEPGQTIEVSTSRVLNGMDEVTMTLSDLSGKHIYNITVDPSALTRVENEYPGQSDSDEQSSSEESVAGTGSQQFSSEAGTSIDVLREEISQSAPFGIAYIGYFDSATADDSGIDFPQWFYAVTSALNENYPFVLEIDEEHTIGTEGFLYCVIAGDYNTSISVNSIDSNELLYRSENGDPVLLFCNHDGDAQKADTTVIITTEDGTEYQWEPTLDENMEHPKLLVGNERELLSWDFTLTPFQNMEFDLDSWLSEGWSGPTAVGLANDSNGADWWISNWDNSINYCLNVSLNEKGDYDGEATLECFYTGDSNVQAQWQGWWQIGTELEQPSRLYLDMALVNGADMASFENAATVLESYRVLISQSGDYLLLVADDIGAMLPIFPENVQAVELMRAYG